MRLLVFGKSGQVAQSLAIACKIDGIEAEFLERNPVDLTNPLACASKIAAADADIIINAGAYTGVDKAEEDTQAAQLVNAASPIEMAREAARRNIPFLHISTDYVFDGSGTVPWREGDRPSPQGVYGRTKLAGDMGVIGIDGPHAILRTAWVFSPFGANFVKTMLRVGPDRPSLNVVDDQFGGPTPAMEIAMALLVIARAFHAGRGVSGIYHFAGQPAVSWADFAEAIFDGHPSAPKIKRIPTSEYPTAARRPMNSVLNCAKIKATYGTEQPDWRIGLKHVLATLKEKA
jgi:dTDP-4-dehydrorhamnose reductase